MANKKKSKTTYDELIEDPKAKKMLDKELHAIAIQEIILALMDSDEKSVRELAKVAGLSKTVIQDLRSGKQKSPSTFNFSNILHALGAEIVVKKGRKVLATL